jgi:hypothetical protein
MLTIPFTASRPSIQPPFDTIKHNTTVLSSCHPHIPAIAQRFSLVPLSPSPLFDPNPLLDPHRLLLPLPKHDLERLDLEPSELDFNEVVVPVVIDGGHPLDVKLFSVVVVFENVGGRDGGDVEAGAVDIGREIEKLMGQSGRARRNTRR